jgi:hypothetical protein
MNLKNMDVEEAIRTLDTVAAKYMGTRQDHDLLKEAIQVVKEATKTN